MNKPRCAFGAVNYCNYQKELFIVIAGGFNGIERLDSIELYSVKNNHWNNLEVKL